jgi:hypothetical protein
VREPEASAVLSHRFEVKTIEVIFFTGDRRAISS